MSVLLLQTKRTRSGSLSNWDSDRGQCVHRKDLKQVTPAVCFQGGRSPETGVPFSRGADHRAQKAANAPVPLRSWWR